jgi:hypothetical protein
VLRSWENVLDLAIEQGKKMRIYRMCMTTSKSLMKSPKSQDKLLFLPCPNALTSAEDVFLVKPMKPFQSPHTKFLTGFYYFAFSLTVFDAEFL